MNKLALPFLGSALLLASCNGGGSVTPGADTTAPNVTLSGTPPTTPGDFALTANAADNVGVTRVEFYRGSTLIATDTTAPYSTAVEVDQRDNGAVNFTAKAYDAAGNVGQGGLNTSININTLYQGDWVWVAVDYSDKLVASGLVTLFDQADTNTGRLALGVYGKDVTPGDPNSAVVLDGGAILGPVTAAGQLQVRFVRNFNNSDLYLLADDDDNAFSAVQGASRFFFDDDAEVRQNGTSTALGFGMGQVSTTPSLDGLSVASQGLSAQSLTELKVAKLVQQASALAASAKTLHNTSPVRTAGQLLPFFQKAAANR